MRYVPDEIEPTPERTLRQRIGGYWAISIQTFCITSVLALLAIAQIEELSAQTGLLVRSWMLLWIFAICIVALVELILVFTIFRNRAENPVAVWVVLVTNALIGVIYSLALSLGAEHWHVHTHIGTIERLSINGFLAMWWGSMLTVFLDFRNEAAKEKKNLINKAVQIALAELERGEFVSRIREELEKEVDNDLADARAQVMARLDDLESTHRDNAGLGSVHWGSISALLQNAAHDSVRSVSQRLWKKTEEIYPKTPWWIVGVNVLREQPLRPLLLAGIDLIAAGPGQIHLLGAARAIPLICAVTVLILFTCLIGNSLMDKFPQFHVHIFLISIGVMQLSVPLRAHFRELWVPGSAALNWQVTQLVAGIILIFLTSGFGAIRYMSLQTRANFRSELVHERIDSIARSRQIVQIAQEASKVLHGAIQTRLIACAMVIERASATGNHKAFRNAIEEALKVLNTPLAPTQFASTIHQEVERKVSLWEELCDFTVHVDIGELITAQESAVTVGRIVEEGIANAIRHGGATQVSIEVTVNDDTIKIVVTDNGSGIKAGTPGMGSAFIQQASAGKWSLKALATGSRLEVFTRAFPAI